MRSPHVAGIVVTLRSQAGKLRTKSPSIAAQVKEKCDKGQAAGEAWLKDVGLTVCDCAQLYKCLLLSLLRANTSHCCLMFCCLLFKSHVAYRFCIPYVFTHTFRHQQWKVTLSTIPITNTLVPQFPSPSPKHFYATIPVTCKTRSTKPNKIRGHGSHLDCISPNGVSNGRMGKVIVTSLQTKHIKRTLFNTIVPRPAETAPLATSQRTNWLTYGYGNQIDM